MAEYSNYLLTYINYIGICLNSTVRFINYFIHNINYIRGIAYGSK